MLLRQATRAPLYAAALRSSFSTTTKSSSSSYLTELAGKQVDGFTLRNESDFRIFITKNGQRISPWHDIEAFPGGKPGKIVNFVNEIPRGTVEKMEISTKEALNPIKQDVKKEKLRLYPFQSLVNYGAIPQTWEDPTHKDASTGFMGDNDPVDVCEIGSRVAAMGEVRPVKVLGILGMIDEGELDWKVLAVDVEDPNAAKLNTVDDVEKLMPGKIQSIVKWFQVYKKPDGKPENKFAFDNKAMDADFAVKVISETHRHWQKKEALKAKGLWVGA